MTTRKNKKYRPMSEINVVPYIDVMLVLLVIFMITAPLLTRGVEVDLPKAAAQNLPPEKLEPLIVSVDALGNLYLNISANPNQPITSEVLQNLVTKNLAETKDRAKRQVLVKGDQRINYGKVLEVMALLKASGAPSVGLMTEDIEQKTNLSYEKIRISRTSRRH
jgi:biopolymer transport protein TolR